MTRHLRAWILAVAAATAASSAARGLRTEHGDSRVHGPMMAPRLRGVGTTDPRRTAVPRPPRGQRSSFGPAFRRSRMVRR
jgi:hypothetical protein